FTLHGAPGIGERETRIVTRAAWALAAVVGAALLVVALGPHRIGDYSTETDFYGAYADGARMIQRGRLDPTRYGVVGPGYEVALALAGFATRDLFLAAELLSTLAAVATLILWFGLLKRRSSGRLALLAALVIATNPHFLRFGYTASTDALALALQAGALYLLLARPGARAAAGAGLVAAAAFLTRYTAIVILPVGVIAAAAGGRPAASGSSRGREAIAFAAGFLIPVGAWLATSLAHGAGFAFQLHHNLAYEVFARARGIGWDAYQRDLEPGFRTLWDVIARDPAAVAGRLAINCVTHLRDDARALLGWPIAACAALGLLLSGWRGGIVRAWPLVLAGALGFLAFVPAFHSERYSLALLPFYAAAAGAFFASPRFALVLGGRVWLKPLFAALPLALAVVASVDLQRRILAQQPTEALDAAETLRSLARPGERVIARKPHVAYLGGVGPVGFPFAESLGDLAAYARRENCRWLFFGFPEAEARPGFRHLLDTTGAVPGLVTRRVTTGRPSVLYEIGPAFGRHPDWYGNDTLTALHDARAVALSSPNDVPALMRVAMIELLRGELVQARAHLERAADLAPNDAEVLLPLGETLLRLGDLGLAAVAYARAEQVSPGNAQARIGRGWVSLLAGREREAAGLWRPVIGATRSGPTLERMRALYLGLGDRGAVAEVEAAIARAEGQGPPPRPRRVGE
ncbi:MAG: tetratricopeptide repeat protein, partial [Candidatus Eiseniibacteriota bacterium]